MGEKRGRGRPKGSKSSYTVSEKALAQRKAVSPLSKIAMPFDGEEANYNARFIEHIMMIHEIANDADIRDPVSMRSCFINYLRLCEKNGFKVGNMAACAAMGISVPTLNNWLKSDREGYRELAQFVKTTCALFREGMIADQKINPVIGIFWQRNFDGLRNDTEQFQAIQDDNETSEKTATEYAKQYGKLIAE